MKSKFNNITDRLEKLGSSMEKINQLAGKIDDHLYVKRNQISKLDIVNKDLQKLNKLCEFPKILKEDLETYHRVCKLDQPKYGELFEKSAQYHELCFNMLN